MMFSYHLVNITQIHIYSIVFGLRGGEEAVSFRNDGKTAMKLPRQKILRFIFSVCVRVMEAIPMEWKPTAPK